ncbi:MAG TPA: endonuclease/exonuclease/phosphatase family protein [Acidimicrobiales bacterium]
MPLVPRADDDTLRVVQLNVGSLLEPHWDRRRHEVVAWLDRLDPDVVCLQEIWEADDQPCTAEWLVEHAGGRARWDWRFGGHPMPEPLWPDRTLRFGSAILTRWPVERHELISLPYDADHPDPRFRFQNELLHVRSAGVDVYSTHLSAAPLQAYNRRREVVAIDEAIRATSDAAAPLPPVLCGDFNAEPGADEIRFLGALTDIDGHWAYYRDAWAAAGNPGPGITADPHTNPACRALNVPPKRIDYVFLGDAFLRPNGAGQVRRAELVFDEPLTGILASDHYGLVVDVVWPDRPPTPGAPGAPG